MVRSVSQKKPLVNSSKLYSNLLNHQRSILLFYSGIKSEVTKKQYEKYLKEFLNYFIIKDYDKLAQIRQKKLQEMVEDFVMYDKSKNKSASYITGKVSALKLFFAMNDVVLNWDKIRKMIPEKNKPTGERAYTTKQIQVLLRNTTNLEHRAIIHFMSASGVRVGSFAELKIKDLTDMSEGCKCVKVYADSKDEYFTFIHHEAVESLNDYLESRKRNGEIVTGDSWVFCSPRNNSKPLHVGSITSALGRFVKKYLGREKSKSGRYSIMSCHGFRKRFDTILKSNRTANISLAERLMGHSRTIPLDNSYFKPVIEQLFDEYQKAIPDLLIDEKYRLEEELKNKNEKIHRLETNKDLRIESLEIMVHELARRLEA
jgi:site-specific recombinase XerD